MAHSISTLNTGLDPLVQFVGAGRRDVRTCGRGDRAIRAESQATLGEVLKGKPPDKIQCALSRIDGRAGRTQLHCGDDSSADEPAFAIKCGQQNRSNALDACNADAVVSCKVAQAIRDQTVFVPLHAAHDMRTMADNQVSAGIDSHAREANDIAARLAVIFLFLERHSCSVPPLCSSVKRHDYNIVRCSEFAHGLFGQIVVEQHVRIFCDRISEYSNADSAGVKSREVTIATGVQHPGRRYRVHCRCATFLAEVTCVVIGKTQDIEARIAIMCCISCWRAEQVAGIRITALLARLPTINEYALEIAERDIRG